MYILIVDIVHAILVPGSPLFGPSGCVEVMWTVNISGVLSTLISLCPGATRVGSRLRAMKDNRSCMFKS